MKIAAVSLSLSIVLAPVAANAAPVSELTLSGGTRTDNLDWNIAGTSPFGNDVNVLSELTWNDLEIWQGKALARVYLKRVYLRGYADYGFITGGSNQDSDYRGNNRTLEYSRSNNSSSDGSVWDVSAGAGYLFSVPIGPGSLELGPLAGLSYHKQNLTITEGFQTIPLTGPFAGLSSTYAASWTGPWAGFDLSYAAGGLTLLGSFEYHLASFRAEADWNLRSDFAHPVSFEHWATGSGLVLSAGAEYNVTERVALSGNVDLQDWSADDGTDRTYFSDGTAADTALNEVNWTSRAVMFGLKYRF